MKGSYRSCTNQKSSRTRLNVLDKCKIFTRLSPRSRIFTFSVPRFHPVRVALYRQLQRLVPVADCAFGGVQWVSVCWACEGTPVRPATDHLDGRNRLSRHDPTAPDATPLSPDARRDTTNVRPKVRAMPSIRSFIISQIWNLQRLPSLPLVTTRPYGA
jgi:hypothetical protein